MNVKIGELKGVDLRFYGQGSVKAYRGEDSWTVAFYVRNHKIGEIIVGTMKAFSQIWSALEDGFRVIPPSYSKKWRNPDLDL